MVLLLLLLVIVEERLRALWGEVRREGAGALTALGAPGLTSAVLDVERPRLLADVLAPLAHGGVQAHPRHLLPVVAKLLVLLRDHRFETGLVHRPGIGQSDAHPVAHLPVERPLGEVLAAQLPVLRRCSSRFTTERPCSRISSSFADCTPRWFPALRSWNVR